MSEIEIIFKGKDETGAATASVKENLSEVSAGADSTAESLSNIEGAVTAQAIMEFKDAAVAAFSAVADAVGEFINAAAEAEVIGVRMEATIAALGGAAPTTARQINELATELSALTGFDDDELVAAQTSLARFGTISEANFERATRAAVDLAAATGMDLTSAFQSVGMAMDKGDFGRLARQIGDLSPEMQKAAEDAMKMGDTLKAQEIILTGLEEKVGGVGEQLGETFTGQMNKLTVEYGNFQEAVGAPMIGLFTDLPPAVKTAGFSMYELGGTLGPVISSMADLRIALMGLQGAQGLGGIAALGKTAFLPMLGSLALVAVAVAAVVAVWYTWNEQIVKTNEEGQKALQGTWVKFFDDLEAGGADAEKVISEYRAAQDRANAALDDANPFVRLFISNQEELTNADKELEASLRRVTNSEEEFQAALKKAKETSTEVVEANKELEESTYSVSIAVRDDLITAFDQANSQIGKRAEEISSAWMGLVESIGSTDYGSITVFEDGTGALASYAQALGFSETASQSFGLAYYEMMLSFQASTAQLGVSFEELKSWFGGLYVAVNDGLKRAGEAIAQWFTTTRNRFSDGINALAESVRSVGTRFVAAGRAIVEGIWKGIADGWEWLKSQISTNMNSLLSWVQDTIDGHSPSRLYAEKVGLPMAQGIGVGFAQGMAVQTPLMSAALIPAPVSAGAMGGGGGGPIQVNGNFAFYSPLTHNERRTIRRDQEETAQRELLRALRYRR